ncbi:hypothetical protein [uncultured Phenylobacterium sp.]|uniref:hypothetical protein n=1 Tax=uncultured Phenylobacterium sp. TaxID=349273 RepID=UPI0025F37F9A|nr:hypothetical protein [uncultured Phenylobacterium sp.]
MDLMRIIRSFEEFIYEVMTWLLFYPRTLVRILRHPVGMLEYAIAEQADPPEDQYSDSLSPPLFLMLTVVVCYIVERMTHLAPAHATNGLLGQLLKSAESTLVTRSLLYAIFPLVFAADYIQVKRLALTRQTLRPAFFGQCYLAGGFILLIAIGATALRLHAQPVIGAAPIAVGVVWYLTANTLWFRKSLAIGAPSAVMLALRGFALAMIIILALLTGIALTSLTST